MDSNAGYYSLYIRRYKRLMDFTTIEELRAELQEYFTPREIALGIVDRLTNFDGKLPQGYGYVKNSYQDIEAFYYPPILNEVPPDAEVVVVKEKGA